MRQRQSATDGVQEVPQELYRSRLDGMFDLRHPLARLARRMPWEAIEQNDEKDPRMKPFPVHGNGAAPSVQSKATQRCQ
ncbi:MAG: hypothetical protein RL026_1764 [Pseudomonadota bacterium]